MKRLVIFCDFDGTITVRDNIISIMKQFAPPKWEKVKDDILSQNMSIQEGVGQLFSLIPTYEKDRVIDYVLSHAEIRKGFKEFVAFTKKEKIPLYVVSGGIDFFVYPVLKPYIPEEHIFCNEADFSGEYIQIHWPHSCDDVCHHQCGCCKPSVLRKLTTEQDDLIVIGDSITDLQAAKIADVVFARDFLAEKCEEEGIPYHRFETFFDILTYFKQEKVVNV